MLDLSDKLGLVGWRRHAFLQWVDGRSIGQIARECCVTDRYVTHNIRDILKAISDEDRKFAEEQHVTNRSKWTLPKDTEHSRPICPELYRIGLLLADIANTKELPSNNIALCRYFNVTKFTMMAMLQGTFDLEMSFLLRIADFFNLTIPEMFHGKVMDNVNIIECRRKLVLHYLETEEVLRNASKEQPDDNES